MLPRLLLLTKNIYVLWEKLSQLKVIKAKTKMHDEV